MEWISTRDRMPDYDVPVLWIDKSGFMFVNELDKDGNDWLNGHYDTELKWIIPPVSHWMPLPAPPANKNPA